MDLDIVFRGVAAPLRLSGAETVLAILPSVMAGWPYACQEADPKASPFFSIAAEPGTALLRSESHIEDKAARKFDAVNALCDAISTMALALPAERADLICLHAAGVAMGGRLVVFPNVRRAGKSTLSAALAQAGHQVFSDDVVPVFFNKANRAYGLAMGIAPRLRLPLPETFGTGFHDWVGSVAGPGNRQYQYLTIADQPAHGSVLPIGAFVVLDRLDAAGPARLTTITPSEAMDVLLHQNFTRDRHSGDILQSVAAALADRPAFKLTYSTLAEAVNCLEAAFSDWADPGPSKVPGATRSFRQACFDRRPPVLFTADIRLEQRPGSLAVPIGGNLYLADAEGRAIHRMDPLASVIWTLVAEPISPDEIIEVLTEVFPDTGRDEMTADLYRLLGRLGAAGLICQVPTD